MALIALKLCGAIAVLVLVAMLSAIARHRAQSHDETPHHTALVEYVWAAIPWLMIAVCALPAVRLIVAEHDKAREIVASSQR